MPVYYMENSARKTVNDKVAMMVPTTLNIHDIVMTC